MADTRTVLRYKLQPSKEEQTLMLPAGARVLHVGIKAGEPFVSLWALSYSAEPEERKFLCVGTGPTWPVGHRVRYCGTAIDQVGGTVWHVFEVDHGG